MSEERLLVQGEEVSNGSDLRQFNITKRVYIAFMSIFNVADMYITIGVILLIYIVNSTHYDACFLRHTINKFLMIQ